MAPDVGIDNAFDRLGLAVSAGHGDDHLPWDRLTAILAESPIIVGPVDLAHLPCQRHRFDKGADHSVLAYASERDRVLLHDPWGFPHVHLDRDEPDRA